jgi:hypothetical protein
VTWTQDCVRRYTADDTIRTIARDTGRSYGFIHKLLTEARTPMRSRGGPREDSRKKR